MTSSRAKVNQGQELTTYALKKRTYAAPCVVATCLPELERNLSTDSSVKSATTAHLKLTYGTDIIRIG